MIITKMSRGLLCELRRPRLEELQELIEASTWTPKVCKIMAFWAIIWGLGLLFYMLLGFG